MGTLTVAVIGCGVTGLCTLKNLLEEGFDCTAFDSRPSIGGLWKFTESETDISVLGTTVSNASRYRNCYSDFPYPKDATPFPDAKEVQEYLESYAKHFNLLKNIQLSTKAIKIVRNATDSTWTVHLAKSDGTTTQIDFDKIAVCQGEWGIPKMPMFEQRDKFEGEIIHSLAFKRPKHFDGKRVIVLGLGNNAADISTSLVGHAKNVYLAHRRGANLIPRFVDGKPSDLTVTLRLSQVKYIIAALSPALAEVFFNTVVRSITNKAFKLKPEWKIHPAPSILTHQPTVTDNLVDCLTDDRIISRPNIRRFTGPKSVEFSDGSTAEDIDAIICCTGFTRDFSLIPDMLPILFPSATKQDLWTSHLNSDGRPLPHLYQNIFPLKGYMPIADLASMAVTQVWKGTLSLPNTSQVEKQIDSHHAWLVKQLQNGTVANDFVEEESWLRAMHDLAGTGYNEMLGYGIAGWKWWLSDPSFASLIMGGVESAFMMRLFDGKRKKWEGAREAIVEVNRQVEALTKEKKME